MQVNPVRHLSLPPSAPSVGDWGFRKEIADGVDASGLSAIAPDSKPWLENRISRCFFGPIKRPPFNRDELMDDIDYYPEAYLAQLRDEGVNGLWLTVEFRDLVETSFNHRHPTAAKRLAKLRRTVGKCAKYGLGIWVFAIEPRCGNTSPEFYAANTNLFAKAYWPPCDDWDHLTCPSLPGSRRYLKEALKDLFTEVPGLKGFINITYGERWTTCLSQFPCCEKSVPRPQLCSRCEKRQPWEILNDILVPMRDGIREGNPKAEFISWFYMPEPCAERDDWVYDCVRHFPKGVSFQMNFESGVVSEQAGRPRIGGDYWLSQPGPSAVFRRAAEVARESGTRLAAKIQVSTSHEMATVPYVPVPGLLYRKFKAMRDCDVRDAMYCWYFGCNPGLMNRAAGMLACEDFADGEDAFLGRLAAQDWGVDAPRMARLWKRFSDAYIHYPLGNMMQYYGPFHDGVVWELHPDLDLRPLPRSWQRDRADGDTIGECLEGFDLDEACSLAERMCVELEDTSDLDALAAKYAGDVRRSRELGVMQSFRILCRSGRDILKFYRARRDAVFASRLRHDNAEALRQVREMTLLATGAKAHAAQILPLCERDSRLGFHSEAETYKFHPELLKWRQLSLDRTLARLGEIAQELASGKPYPQSDFERIAPVHRVVRAGNGGLLVEGEASLSETGDVEIVLVDLTGSDYPSTFRVAPENGRFRTVVPDRNWGWIRIVRPGLPPIPEVKAPVPLRLGLLSGAARNCARLEVVERTASVRNHALYDSISLNGAWEMAYQPYAWESREMPVFKGVTVAHAVPGYWEDMIDDFRKAGMTDVFRTNAFFRIPTFPISGYSSDATLPNIRGCFFYRRRVDLAGTAPVYLAFEGVRNQVHLWVNGAFVAFRAGFSTPFELEIPVDVQVKGENEIVLAVSNDPNLGYCGAEVCGLTTRALFQFTGGINGNLELRMPKNALGDVYVTTAADLSSFTLHVPGSVAYGYEILDGADVVAKGAGRGDEVLPTAGLSFWSPENPKRYRLRLRTAEGAYEQLFGLRRLTADGERLKLNGRYVYLRGVTEHCYFPETVHLPRDLDYYRMITRKRKELGFNFLRFHTYVPPVEYLEATDELGMLVHIETPNFVPEPEFEAIVSFARRHPSVVIYCTGNETRIDRLAERYLEDVAEIVHRETDSLFSPMSALRGVEYFLVPGKDVIVEKPFPHNPERLRRLNAYCDLYTSFQQGAVSYGTIEGPSAAKMDEWGDVYGKPRLSHEICIQGTYVDLGLEALYPKDSPFLRTGIFRGLRAYLADCGVLERADTYFRNSCEWMRRLRKYAFEKIRSSARTSGYDFLGDINTHWHTCGYSVGMMDEFYRLKPGETVGNVLRYNSAAVLLCDLDGDFNVVAGTTKRIGLSLSNYADDEERGALAVRLVDPEGRAASEETRTLGRLACGTVAKLGDFEIAFPKTDIPRKYVLKAVWEGERVRAENEWEMYAFPPVAACPASDGVKVVTDCTLAALQADMAAGRRVVLLGAGPFRRLDAGFAIGSAGRCHGNYATVIRPGHPALGDFPHEGYCGWQFRNLMRGSLMLQLEAGVPFDPIIDVASSVKYVIRQSNLFEYRVGTGRLLVSSLAFHPDDPAANWLKAQLVAYAASDAFEPHLSLTPGQLRAVCEAPLKFGYIGTNRARNPNDPSSTVRSGDLAQP